jgi:FMN phosphatase YigB (HAD superfamily)
MRSSWFRPITADRLALLERRLEGVDVVSFDVFDTLVVRTVARPVDAFRIAHERLNESANHYLALDMAQYRIEAEASLREEASRRGLSPDCIRLDEIVARLAERTALPDSIGTAWRNAELETERLVFRPSPWGVAAFELAKAMGKEIVLVSDTYFPPEFVEDIVRGVGIDGWKRLFASCENGRAKSDGSQFALLLAEYADERILHIGDNPESDGWRPRSFGVDVLEVPNQPHAMRDQVGPAEVLNGPLIFGHLQIDGTRLKNVQRSLVNGCVAQMLQGQVDDAYVLGYGALGPLLTGYVQWLHAAAVDAGISDLLFLARDGYLVMEAYRALFGTAALPSTFVLASRRLFNFAAIADRLTARDMDCLLQTSIPIPVGEYFARLGIPEVDRRSRVLLHDLGVPSGRIDGSFDPARAVFWQIEPELVGAAADERVRLIEYLHEIAYPSMARPGLVDVGWHGSLQWSFDRVCRLAGLPSAAGGFYLGLHDTPRRRDFSTQAMTAYLDEAASPEDAKAYADLVRTSVSAIETLFTQTTGSVIGLTPSSDGDGWRGVFGESAYTAADVEAIEGFQAGALQFIADFADAADGLPAAVAQLERSIATENLVMALNFPTVRAAEVLGTRTHVDGMGLAVSTALVGSPGADERYVTTPGALAADQASTNWKQGFSRLAELRGLSV